MLKSHEMKLAAALVAALLVPLLAAGCAAPKPAAADGQSSAAAKGKTTRKGGASGSAAMSMTQAGSLADPKDPPLAQMLVFHVEIYQVQLPFGTFSSNEDFWKRIDEQAVDVATYDLLYKNGLRVGVAPVSEYQTFRQYINEFVPAQRFTVTAIEAKNVEVPMKRDLPEQAIFYFDDANEVVGHSYDRCENLLSMSFEPTPRRPGSLRLTMCPMVRSQRRVLQFNATNEAREFAFVHPHRLYDLNLTADIPQNCFLVLTASSYADSHPSSIGRAFMTADGAAQRMEQVLLVVPRGYLAPAEPSLSSDVPR